MDYLFISESKKSGKTLRTTLKDAEKEGTYANYNTLSPFPKVLAPVAVLVTNLMELKLNYKFGPE